MNFDYSKTYDVVVCGGGTAGIMAGIAAARSGARTIIVERQGFLGGTAVLGGSILGFYGPEGGRIVGGIPNELVERLCSMDASPGHIPFPRWNSFTPVNTELFKSVSMQMFLEAGGELLLHAMIVGVTSENRQIYSVTVETGDGPMEVQGRCFVDASGDAHIAYKANLAVVKGTNLQAGSNMIRLAGFNKSSFVDFIRQNPKEARGFNEGWSLDLIANNEYFAFCGLFSFLKKANAEWGLNLPRDFICFNTSVPSDTVVMVASRTTGFDGTSIIDLTRAEIEARGQDTRLVALLRDHVPGFESSYLISAGHQIGVRETRRLAGAYVLGEDDILEGRTFDDTVALGGYPIDVHYANRYDNRFTLLKQSYQIPFRCMISDGCDNLIVAGRPISVTPVAYGSTRVQPVCMAIGQAAGVGAAMAVEQNVPVARLPEMDIRGTLRAQGAIVDQPEKPKWVVP